MNRVTQLEIFIMDIHQALVALCMRNPKKNNGRKKKISKGELFHRVEII